MERMTSPAGSPHQADDSGKLVILPARDFRLPEVLRHIEAGRVVRVIPATQGSRPPGAGDYTVAELRGIAAEHGLPTPSRLTHDELVELITTAGVPLPPKLPERMQPFRRRRGPLAD